MDAVILAGGLGTRLRSVVKDTPKPMAEVNGRPFLCYLLDYLSAGGVDRVVLSVGFKHEAFEEYFGTCYRNLDISYVVESEPLGTGGAVREALKVVEGSDFMILNGDSFFAVELEEFTALHKAKGATLTLSVKPMTGFDRYGSVLIEQERVTGFEEKGYKKSGYINGGVYLANRSISEHFKRYEQEKKFSFETDFLEKNINSMEVAAFVSDSYFIDIGTPEDYEKASAGLGKYFKGEMR